ncbi:MAG TPA: peptidoglycan DD-metalloendopeptidase family protein [Thermoanaerobaculia bacterium]|nr:peptidoglycan DD-metalloendopeptidase family protein [Thermoanaerobaculia bacterium]
MKMLVPFFAGAILGALLVFYWEESRRPAVLTAQAAEPSDAEAAAPSETPFAPMIEGVPPPADDPATRPAVTPVRAVASVNASASEALAIPVAGIVPSMLRDHYDDARGSRVHHAIDIPAPRGTPVLASVDGTIAKLFVSAAGGITIYEFDEEERWVYYYAHLDGYAPGLTEKQKVKRGEVIGFVGTSGNAPPGVPHLHFAIERLPASKEWWKGEAVNPYPLLVSRGVTYK